MPSGEPQAASSGQEDVPGVDAAVGEATAMKDGERRKKLVEQ